MLSELQSVSVGRAMVKGKYVAGGTIGRNMDFMINIAVGVTGHAS